MACRLRALDGAVDKTIQWAPRWRENSVRKVGATALVEDARVEVWLGPAIVKDLNT